MVPLLAAWGGRRALLYASYGLLAIAYLVILFYGWHSTPGDKGEWTNSFVHFQFFCAGTLIALFLRGRVIDVALPLRIAGFALGFCLWLTAMIHFRVQSWDPQPTPAGSVIGWLLVLAATSLFFLAALGTPSRYIPPWLAYFGRISYGLYMVHSLMFFSHL